MSAPWSYIVKMHRANEPDKEWIAEGKISQAEAKQMAKQIKTPSRMPEAISKLREEEEKAKTRNLMRRAKPIVKEPKMMEEDIPTKKLTEEQSIISNSSKPVKMSAKEEAKIAKEKAKEEAKIAKEKAKEAKSLAKAEEFHAKVKRREEREAKIKANAEAKKAKETKAKELEREDEGEVPDSIKAMVVKEVEEDKGFTQYYPDEWFKNAENVKYNKLLSLSIKDNKKDLLSVKRTFMGNNRRFNDYTIKELQNENKEKEEKIKEIDRNEDVKRNEILQKQKELRTDNVNSNSHRERLSDNDKKIYDRIMELSKQNQKLREETQKTTNQIRKEIGNNLAIIRYHKEFKVRRIVRYEVVFSLHNWDKIKEQLAKHPEYKELYDRMEKQVNDTIEYNRTHTRKHATIHIHISVLQGKTRLEGTWEIRRYKDEEFGYKVNVHRYEV